MALRRTIMLTALAFAVAALALTVAVASPGSAQTKAGGTHRPLRGHLSGVGTPGLPPGNFFGDEKTGVISHLGRVAYHVEGTFAQNGSGSFDLDGTVVIVTANGDALRGAYHGTTSTGAVVAGTVHLTGGTGRFSDVSGTWAQTDRNTQTPGEAFPNRGTTTIKGHISY